MHMTRRAAALPLLRLAPLALALVAGGAAQAASFGHARLVSASGQPLAIDVALREVSSAEAGSLQASIAPIDAWRQAGLTPPVDPSTLSVTLAPGRSADTRVVQVRSSQPFQGPVADLLLDLHSATGRQLHQVSVLARPGVGATPPVVGSANQAAASQAASASAAGTVRVRKGDTLYGIARRHAVPGVSIYQMMAALYNANPQAFMRDNMNLLKAGATLSMPDQAALSALSDAQARQLFARHNAAHAARLAGAAGGESVPVAGAGRADAGSVEHAKPKTTAAAPAAGQDQLRLSGKTLEQDAAQDNRLATQRNLAESTQRVSQLEQNVQNLSQALQSQGEAAQDAVLSGARDIGQTLASVVGSSDTSSPASGQGTPGVAVAAASASGLASGAASGTHAASGASGASGQPGAAGAAGASSGQPGAAASAAADTSAAAQADQAAGSTQASWLESHLLAVVTALLALVVLIVAWLLRRANVSRDDDDQAAPVTEAMVRQQLEKINLDLHEPPDEPAARSR